MSWSVCNVVPVEVVGVGPDLTPEGGGYSKQTREEPDQGDVDGMWPGARYEPILSGKVPLAVFNEQVEGEEQGCQGQEEQEAVVEVSVADAVFVTELPSQGNDLRVKGEGHAQ